MGLAIYKGYTSQIWRKRFSKGSSPNFILHINSVKLVVSKDRCAPHFFLFLCLALHHIDSTWFVVACVTGSTKFSLWLTVRCQYPKLFTVPYALHKSDTTVDPGITYSCKTGNRVSASRLSTATKKPSFISVSSPPKTHWVLTTWPTSGVSNSFWFAGRMRLSLVSGGPNQWDHSITTNSKYRPIM